MNDKVLALMGLCARAGKLQSGELPAEKSIKKGTAQLLVIAGDASDNTKKKFKNMAEYRDLPYFCTATGKHWEERSARNSVL